MPSHFIIRGASPRSASPSPLATLCLPPRRLFQLGDKSRMFGGGNALLQDTRYRQHVTADQRCGVQPQAREYATLINPLLWSRLLHREVDVPSAAQDQP